MAGFSRRVIVWMFWGWVALMAWLTMVPSPPVPSPPVPGFDKVEHAGAFALFTFLAGRFLDPVTQSPWKMAVGLAFLYGGAIEIAQGLLPLGRSAEWGDLAADVAGSIVVYWFMTRKADR